METYEKKDASNKNKNSQLHRNKKSEANTPADPKKTTK
jgi:hypothetical protein